MRLVLVPRVRKVFLSFFFSSGVKESVRRDEWITTTATTDTVS